MQMLSSLRKDQATIALMLNSNKGIPWNAVIYIGHSYTYVKDCQFYEPLLYFQYILQKKLSKDGAI